MAASNYTATLNGLFKEIYADNIENLIPEYSILAEMFPMSKREKQGGKYHVPVVLANEQGFTALATGAGVTALNTSVAAYMGDAQVDGYQVYLRTQVDHEVVKKAQGGSKVAFMDAFDLIVKNMIMSMAKTREMQLLYGQSGLAKTSTSANASSTSTVVTFTAASWAPAYWAGSEGARLNFYYNTSTIVPAIAGADAVFAITAVDLENRKLTLSGTAVGIAALDAIAQTSGVSLDAHPYGFYGQEMAGLDKIVTNTGLLFNINATSYALWKGSSYAISGNITIAKIMSGIAQAANRGLSGESILFLNPAIWGDLNGLLAAMRSYDVSWSKDKSDYGFETLTLYGPTGKTTVVPHGFVKTGDGFVVPKASLKRIGACDIGFVAPDQEENQYITKIQGYTGYEINGYYHQAIFCEKPCQMVKLTGITKI